MRALGSIVLSLSSDVYLGKAEFGEGGCIGGQTIRDSAEGLMPYFRMSLRMSRVAARLSRFDCTRMSSTSPSASTARQRYICRLPIETNISSRGHAGLGLGRLARRRCA